MTDWTSWTSYIHLSMPHNSWDRCYTSAIVLIADYISDANSKVSAYNLTTLKRLESKITS